MSRRHKKHHDDHEEHPSEAWLIALADMMTLLMVTFLMMFAIAVVDLQKFKTFAKAFSEATGQNLPTLVDTPSPEEVDAAKTEIAAPPPSASSKPVLDRKELEALKAKVQAAIIKAGIQESVQVEMDGRGLVLYVTSGVLFDSGQAELKPLGKELLVRLGPVFRGMANDLVVEGHTDADPISSVRFPSNWELSTSRATAVLRHLVTADQVDQRRLSASGYADTRPRGSNSTPEGKARNRRVEVVVLPGPQPAPAAPPAAVPSAKTAADEGEEDGEH